MNDRNRALSTVRITSQFEGPPGIGNGGIVCAALAESCGDAFEVTLRRPAPLERDLDLVPDDEGGFELLEGATVVARGRAIEFDLDVPPPPSRAAAEAAHAEAKQSPHPFPRCFVCGPARGEGDGLRVLTAPVPGRPGMVAGPWRPDPAFGTSDSRLVDRRFVWAALDCPGGIAALEGRPSPILLARIRGRLHRRPAVGERCLALGWAIEHDGRKHVSGSALIGADGGVLGCAESLWIEPRSGEAT